MNNNHDLQTRNEKQIFPASSPISSHDLKSACQKNRLKVYKEISAGLANGINVMTGEVLPQLDDYFKAFCLEMAVHFENQLTAPAYSLTPTKKWKNFQTYETTDINLLAKLEMLRGEIAFDEDSPAFYVLSNKVLVELATHKPSTPEQLLEIKGIGPHKLKEYGEEILTTIQVHIENQNNS